jgi:excisionase family DNA binding protein
MTSKLLTTKQACEYLNISETALNALLARKVIRRIPIGRVYRYSIDELDRFIRESQGDEYTIITKSAPLYAVKEEESKQK